MSKDSATLATEVKSRNAYSHWLLDNIMYHEMKKNGRDYTKLLSYLNRRKFIWSIHMDVNRVMDARNLRYLFEQDTGKTIEFEDPISCLEVFIGLAMRIDDDIFDYIPDSSPARFFWMMMENCGLDYYTNDLFDEKRVGNIVSRILNRKYGTNGRGGLFPLKHPQKNQQDVELWYQMQAYIMENFPI